MKLKVTDEQAIRETIVRLQRSITAAADDCVVYLEALRHAVRTIDELRTGTKTVWTEEDTKKLEAIRALCLF
jgi:hypothetical protein